MNSLLLSTTFLLFWTDLFMAKLLLVNVKENEVLAPDEDIDGINSTDGIDYQSTPSYVCWIPERGGSRICKRHMKWKQNWQKKRPNCHTPGIWVKNRGKGPKSLKEWFSKYYPHPSGKELGQPACISWCQRLSVTTWLGWRKTPTSDPGLRIADAS